MLKYAHPESVKIAAVYDFDSWVGDLEGFSEAVRGANYFVAGSVELLNTVRNVMQGAAVTIPPAFIIEPGVDLNMFTPTAATFAIKKVAIWAGNSLALKNNGKGVGLAESACNCAGWTFIRADSVSDKHSFSHKEMPELYQQARCLIVASRSEGTPRTALEALACGVPVVATRVGMIPRLIQHGLNGVIVERDMNAIAAGLRYVDKVLSKRPKYTSVACRAAASEFSQSRNTERWRDVLNIAFPWVG
jgi:hypothetical protein